jgi:glycosyltransferase involved in cell wall biosynthesis
MSGIAVAYSGVHQAFQLGLAAEELGKLDQFYCSFFAGRGSWGRVLGRALGTERLMSRQVAGIACGRIAENPWPWLLHHCRARLLRPDCNDWLLANARFDRWVSRQLQQRASSVFIGVETCAAHSFAVAAECGMIRVLDCPGIPTDFLDGCAARAAAELGIHHVSRSDSAGMRERKVEELRLADLILVSSPLQAQMLSDLARPPRGFRIVPLWADTSFWRPLEMPEPRGTGPLRVLFAGKVSLRKGVPYLMRAVTLLGQDATATFIGDINDELRPLIADTPSNIRLLPSCSKIELRRHYREHDVLVLPSLGDAFGFVALEAMCCGLPVIVTENCGVPIPDPAWRVPVMSSGAIAERLALYVADRDRCRADGILAASFARRYTPERYRNSVKKILREILEPASSNAPEITPNSFVHHEGASAA